MRRGLALLVLGAGTIVAAGHASAQTTPAITLSLSRTSVEYGAIIVASGTVEPSAPGEQVVLELERAGGGWSQVARTTITELGGFRVQFTATAAGVLHAHVTGREPRSNPVSLVVKPEVHLRTKRALAFVGTVLKARVMPAAYDGRVELVVKRGGKEVESVSAPVRGGRISTTVTTPGLGRFRVELTLPAAGDLSARSLTSRVRATARTLSVGTSGTDVRALSRRLAQLRFKVPGISPEFSYALVDSVIAFQKVAGLSPDGVVGLETWRALARTRVPKPRYRAPSQHIEIDESRQILLVVEDREVAAILPTSTGATGNTPNGRHRIRWKAPATTTWLGPGILYRTMTFYGDAVAIHGWPEVPPYPASHGCVRIPIWTADWLYNRSPVGETVYVY